MNKFAVHPMDTTQEFQLFDTSVSLHGDWFSPAQDPDFEGMLMERHFSIKCTSVLKIITRNGLEKE